MAAIDHDSSRGELSEADQLKSDLIYRFFNLDREHQAAFMSAIGWAEGTSYAPPSLPAPELATGEPLDHPDP